MVSSLRGIDTGDLLVAAALHPFVVDEEAGGLGVFLAIGSGELDREV